MAGELLMTISQDERERAKIRSRRMFQTDLASDIATAMDIGEKKGRQEGKAEGRVEGEYAKSLAIARNMMKRNRPIDEIIEDTGLTREEVENMGV